MRGAILTGERSARRTGHGSTRARRLVAEANLSAIERLEGRTLLSTFLVTNSGDNGGVNPAPFAGTGTLRQAIIDANANGGADSIDFNIGGGGLQTIAPLAQLPAIVGTTTLDGTTQPGFAGTPIIELSGALTASGAGLRLVNGANSTIRGLIINRFSGNGIFINGLGAANNVIAGNWIGLDSSGAAAAGNGTVGVSQNLLIFRAGSGNRVGGTSAADRNVVSGGGAAADGIVVQETSSAVIQGNYVGTDATGTVALGNTIGIFLRVASGCTVGGTTAGAGNLVSGNRNNGISLLGSATLGPASGNIVQGNFVGTTAAGTGSLGNTLFGINVSTNALFNTVGGTSAAARNVICFNGQGGMNMSGGSNVVQGNRIGVDAAGNAAGNPLRGINITASGNLIGGSATGAANEIAFNGGAGVAVATGTGNTISRNSIHDNAGLGIDLLPPVGPNPNDPLDPDVGGNNLQNAPVVTSVLDIGGGTLLISGSLDSTPNTAYTVEFFDNDVVDPSGFGEGKLHLADASVTTDALGSATFSMLIAAADATPLISATATEVFGGNTSEFSGTIAAAAPPPGVYEIPDPCGDGGTAVLVVGTADADTVHVNPVGGEGDYEVIVNSTSAGVFDDERIIVRAGDGNDQVQVAGAVAASVWAFGDGGDDRVYAGGNASVLVGGAGNDELLGGSGRDLLIGGEGGDRLIGNASDDILVAGWTDHDDDYVALCRIMDEWTRDDAGFAERVDHLQNGGGLNDPYRLTATTVHDDTSVDQIDLLVGSAGNDWFIYELGEDKANGVTATEAGEVLLV